MIHIPAQNIPEVLRQFAAAMDTKVISNTLRIPAAFGSGYCSGYLFGDQIRLLILNYTLHQDMVLKNPDSDIHHNMILFKLQHVFPVNTKLQKSPLPTVLIATRKVGPDILMPVHTHTATINLEINTDYLSGLIASTGQSTIIASLLANNQPLLFEEAIPPSLPNIVLDIINAPASDPFHQYFLRIKAEEIICHLLMNLEKRKEKRLQPLNQADIQLVYMVRDKILENLDKPPLLSALASDAAVSTSKLKILFKQVFGKPIYNYYQQFRMQEAARLLKEKGLGVAEVGYQLGFTNMSHFGRLFEQHIGVKPKKYASQS